MSVPVVLVAGLHGPARASLTDRLIRENSGAVAIHHDLRAIADGRIVRLVRDGSGLVEQAPVSLAHGCVSCTIREDLLPELVRRADQASLLVVDLWDCVEPRMVAEVLDHVDLRDLLRVTAVMTALDAEHLPVDLCRGDPLREIGKSGSAVDERYLAEVLARQIEYATVLVLPELMPAPLPGIAAEDIDLCREVLAHLAPTTDVIALDERLPSLDGPGLCAMELAARVDPATAVLPCENHTPGVDTVVWRRSRPLHPERFFEAADTLAAESVRSRGRFWLANRPARMIAWDAAAGVVGIEDAGPWLATLTDAEWDSMPAQRRLVADMDWSPEFGDRVQHLVFTGPELDTARIHALLDACLLADGEPTAFPDDPFVDFLDLKETV